MHIPDFLPELTNGSKSSPDKGGCVMQVTSFLWDGGWTDSPDCTDRGLANIAIAVNDNVSDEARRGMFAAVAELTGTAFFDIEPEAEDEAVTALEEYTRATFPFGAGHLLGDEQSCEGCCDRWNCLAERIECLFGVVTTWAGDAPNFENVVRELEKYDMSLDTELARVYATFGHAVAKSIEGMPPDWRERQHQVVAWFVDFLRKYREVFGAAEAKEIVDEDWRRVVDHMTPA